MMYHRPKTIGKWWGIGILVGTLLLSSCATAREILQVHQPKLHFENAHITGLSFEYETFKSLKLQDDTAYQIAGGLAFDLPVLGPARVPFSVGGEIPAVKLPDMAIEGLQVKKLNLSGADLVLEVEIKNPNAFDLLLNSLDYELAINGKTWVTGDRSEPVPIVKKSWSAINIPISLDFAQIGATVYQMLSGTEKMNYQFRGSLNMGSSLPLLKQATIPFNRSGILPVFR